MSTEPLYRRQLSAITHHPEERERIIALLARTRADHRVRTTIGILMRAAAREINAAALRPVEPLLEETLRSPLGMVTIAEGAAFALLLGSVLYPEKSLEEAANFTIESAIAGHRDFPFIKTMLLSCDSDWLTFLEEYSNWTRLVWNLDTHVEIDDPKGRAFLTADSSALLFLAPGFWRGFMRVFGMQGQIKLDDIDEKTSAICYELLWE